jgi:hypothetical protein
MDKNKSGLRGKIKINERMINFLLILILGFLVGVAVKTEAKKRITIGYNDYITSNMKQGFDLAKPDVSADEQQNQPTDEGATPAPTDDSNQPQNPSNQ